MTNAIHVRSYTRQKARSEKPDPILMDLLAMDLAVKLSEPLEQFNDVPEADKQRMRESF